MPRIPSQLLVCSQTAQQDFGWTLVRSSRRNRRPEGGKGTSTARGEVEGEGEGEVHDCSRGIHEGEDLWGEAGRFLVAKEIWRGAERG
jgi:hypothetical protein